MPLSAVEPGRRVRFVGVDAGWGLEVRLAEMGLLPGVEIEIIKKSLHGPYIIDVKGSRIIIGSGMALKMLVE